MVAAFLARLWTEFSPFLGAVLVGVAKQLWDDYQANRAMVDAGAAQQRAADRSVRDAITGKAREKGNATAAASDADNLARLDRWRQRG